MTSRRSLLKLVFATPLLALLPKIKLQSPPRHLTLLDVARANDPNLLPVVEALSQWNRFLQEMEWKTSSMIYCRYTSRSALPFVSFGKVLP